MLLRVTVAMKMMYAATEDALLFRNLLQMKKKFKMNKRYRNF